MKILITDDHAVVRSGLIQILSREFKDATFGEAADGAVALRFVTEAPWDLCLLDINLQGKGGLEVLAEMKAVRPKMPILILSMHPEDQFGLRVFKAGADGYLNKDAPPETLLNAVRQVLSGSKYVSSALAQKLASSVRSKGRAEPKLDELSDREFAVLRFLCKGLSLKEIAGKLEVSPKTVTTYRQRILNKLGKKSNAELVQYAIQNHLED